MSKIENAGQLSIAWWVCTEIIHIFTGSLLAVLTANSILGMPLIWVVNWKYLWSTMAYPQLGFNVRSPVYFSTMHLQNMSVLCISPHHFHLFSAILWYSDFFFSMCISCKMLVTTVCLYVQTLQNKVFMLVAVGIQRRFAVYSPTTCL